ncbi:unnamed protein product [Amoebophrya sp. A25]|nr:unnamed protein product [Amoebophrya sp. A25]|eukprot:GSA25T00015760001.1
MTVFSRFALSLAVAPTVEALRVKPKTHVGSALVSAFGRKTAQSVAKSPAWDVLEVDCRGMFGFGCEAFDAGRFFSRDVGEEAYGFIWGKHAFCYENPGPAQQAAPAEAAGLGEPPTAGAQCVDKRLPGDGGCAFFPPAYYGIACMNMEDPATGVLQHYSCLEGTSEPIEAGSATEHAFEEGTGGNTGYSCQKCCSRILFESDEEADKWCAKKADGSRVADCVPDATEDPLYGGVLSIVKPGSKVCLPPGSAKEGGDVSCGMGIWGKMPQDVPEEELCMGLEDMQGAGQFAGVALASERVREMEHEMLIELAVRQGACPMLERDGGDHHDHEGASGGPSEEHWDESTGVTDGGAAVAPPAVTGSGPPPPPKAPAVPKAAPKAAGGKAPPPPPAAIPEPGAASAGTEPVTITTNPDPQSAAGAKAAAMTPPSFAAMKKGASAGKPRAKAGEPADDMKLAAKPKPKAGEPADDMKLAAKPKPKAGEPADAMKLAAKPEAGEPADDMKVAAKPKPRAGEPADDKNL